MCKSFIACAVERVIEKSLEIIIERERFESLKRCMLVSDCYFEKYSYY